MPLKAVLVVVFALLAPPASAQQGTYTVVDLGATDGFGSESNGINASGTVIGQTNFEVDPVRGFVFQNGIFRDIRTLFPGHNWPIAVNNSNEVIGDWQTSFGEWRVFRYLNGNAVDIGSFAAMDINNNGQIAGYTGSQIFIQNRDGSRTTLPGRFLPYALNDYGGVVGYSTTSTPYRAAVYYGGQVYELTNFGLPSVRESFATDINNRFDMIGVVSNGSSCGGTAGYPFMLRSGQLIAIPHFGIDTVFPAAMNNNGIVVGCARIPDREHGFLFDGTRTHDLNDLIPSDSGWEISRATGINDEGNISAIARTSAGAYRAVLLTRSVPPAACGTELGPAVALQRYQYSIGTTSIVLEIVTVQNTTAAPIAGPVSFVVRGVQNGLYAGDARTTSCFSPLPEPWVTVETGSDGILSPGETGYAVLWFVRTSGGIEPAPLSYVPRVLQGVPGA